MYRAIDGLGNSDTATVTMTVTSVNDAPVAVNDTSDRHPGRQCRQRLSVAVERQWRPGAANEDQTLTIDPATLTQPAHGTVTLINGNTQVAYTPVANYFGSDSFQYSVIDSGGLESGLATVSITVDNVNDAPTVQNDQATGILEDSTSNAINVLANDEPGPVGVGDESSVDCADDHQRAGFQPGWVGDHFRQFRAVHAGGRLLWHRNVHLYRPGQRLV